MVTRENIYLSKVVDVVQCLQQRVHVASGSLVLEANIARGLFAVVMQVFWTVNLDHYTHLQGVIHQKASGSLVDLLLSGKGGEAPVISLR